MAALSPRAGCPSPAVDENVIVDCSIAGPAYPSAEGAAINPDILAGDVQAVPGGEHGNHAGHHLRAPRTGGRHDARKSIRSPWFGNATASVIPVFISPGQTQFARTPRLAYSMAILGSWRALHPLLAERPHHRAGRTGRR